MMALDKALMIGKRWQKGNMDRVYINLTEEIMNTEASNEVAIGKWFNRYERSNLKAFYDVNAEELIITAGSDEAKAELKNILENI